MFFVGTLSSFVPYLLTALSFLVIYNLPGEATACAKIQLDKFFNGKVIEKDIADDDVQCRYQSGNESSIYSFIDDITNNEWEEPEKLWIETDLKPQKIKDHLIVLYRDAQIGTHILRGPPVRIS
ncbi:hypothetical protein EYV94_16510 [Puteibacter caeruleilacunae]|nr:hypothetical protein EYV94_16510 [Puteibacter caeruleilacunae]